MKHLILVIGLLFAFTATAATINYTQTTNAGPMKSENVTYTAIRGTSDTATGFKLANYNEASVYVGGTFASATVTLHGSNDGVSYTALTDQANAALACTAECLKTVQQAPLYIKPVVTGTSVSASITVRLHLKTN